MDKKVAIPFFPLFPHFPMPLFTKILASIVYYPLLYVLLFAIIMRRITFWNFKVVRKLHKNFNISLNKGC